MQLLALVGKSSNSTIITILIHPSLFYINREKSCPLSEPVLTAIAPILSTKPLLSSDFPTALSKKDDR